MKAIILAGGENGPIHKHLDYPKALIRIGDKTIVERQIDLLKKSGLKEQDIVLVTGYKHEMFEMIHPYTILNEDYKKTSNIFGVELAFDNILKTNVSDNDEILILDSDLVFDDELIEDICKSEKKNLLAVREIDWYPEIKHEVVLMDDEEKIKQMVVPEKGKTLDSKYSDKKLFRYVGIMKISGDVAKKFNQKIKELKLKDVWYTVPLVSIISENDFAALLLTKSIRYCLDIEDSKEQYTKHLLISIL